MHDIRYGLRMMLKTPVVSAVAILSLSLGIAANASMFSLLNAFLLEPFPYADQDGLVILREGRQGEGIESASGVSIPNFRAYEAAGRSIESLMAYTLEAANLTGLDVPEQITVVEGTPNLFDVLGVQPSLGRNFDPEEGSEGMGNVLVLEHDFWKSRFMSDPNVLGRTMTVDGTIYTIIGVMPATFDMLPANVDVFRPTDFVDQMDRHDSRNYLVLGRLFPGADAAAVQRELAGVSARLASEHPDANRGWELHSAPVRSFFPGPTDRRLFSVMTAVTIFALLIACANVANLLLARAESRQKEIAVRTAMGAGRHRILRQLLTESVVMGAVAGVIGSILAIWVVRWLQTSMPAELPATLMPVLSPRVVVATLAVSVMAGIVFGMAPAIHAARADLREALGEGARGGTAGRSRKRIRNAFVVSEFAVALALLTTSGILVEAFDRMSNADPGFDTEGLLTLEVSIGDDRYPSDTEVWTYQEELIRALEHVPGVGGVALMSSLPRSRSNPQSRYTVDGRPVPDPSEQPTVSTQAVNPSYFDAMGIPLLQGRTFGEVDGPEGQPVMVVSRSFAEREFPGEDPLGRSVTVGDESRVIVGVADDVLQERLALAGEGGQGIYVPAAQGPERNPAIAVRSTLETG
ncbi:MAG: ABC transporter permease, partial [Gemmatimonadota bacterium]|nr:ABC transporter permease [Gemmatimonadota bacterium]